jgi:hypothetical protein
MTFSITSPTTSPPIFYTRIANFKQQDPEKQKRLEIQENHYWKIGKITTTIKEYNLII